MTRQGAVIIGVAIIVLALAAVWAWMLFRPMADLDGMPPALETENEEAELIGNLTKGTGDSEGWNIVYDEEGAPARMAELALPEDETCTDAGSYLVCGTLAFQNGDRVAVRGEAENGTINVSNVTFADGTSTRTVQLYYYDAERDKDETGNVLCSRQGLVPVSRTIAEPSQSDEIEKVIRLHLLGALTKEEQDAGVTTEYPLSGIELTDVALEDGELTLTFEDPENSTSGGACRIGVLWFQIERTATQFPDVDSVTFMPEELFQP